MTSSGRLTDRGYENPRAYDVPGSAFVCDYPRCECAEICRATGRDVGRSVVERSIERTLAVGAKADEYRERWDPEQRYRLFVRKAGTAMADRREIMAVASSTLIGPMLELARSEGEYGPGDRSAVLDTAPWEFGNPGEWIVGSLA